MFLQLKSHLNRWFHNNLYLVQRITLPILNFFAPVLSLLYELYRISRLDQPPVRQPIESTHTTAMASEEPTMLVQLQNKPVNDQSQSDLFSKIPGEIRNTIFHYALMDYEDSSSLYNEQTCYRRPNYLAPRKASTALLRTCKRVYLEAWFRPWTSAEQTFYLTASDRRPSRVTTVPEMQRMLDRLHTLCVQSAETPENVREIEVDSVRIFPQLYMLEPGTYLSRILNMRHFHPRTVTVTIRHTDWWYVDPHLFRLASVSTYYNPNWTANVDTRYWENDAPLKIDSNWVNTCVFPASTREVRLELESLERKKNQVEWMAKAMADTWHFKRSDGIYLSAKDVPTEVMRWSGNSTWNQQRWIRDENRPETLDYYVLTVVWRPVRPTGGLADEEMKREAPNLRHPGSDRMSHAGPESVSVFDMQAAEVPSGLDRDEVVRRIQEWRDAQAAARRRRMRARVRNTQDGPNE